MYSDGGFAIAELVIEEITGSTFEEYVSNAILKPLGLEDTEYSGLGLTSKPYSAIMTELPVTHVASRAASGLYSTIQDLAEFATASLGETTLPVNQTDVLSKESILFMQTPSPDTRGGYGLGYSTRTTPAGDAVVGHGAASEGWHANVALMPARGKGIIILTNSSSGGNVSTRIRCDWYHDIIGAIPAGACKTDLGARIVKPLLSEGVDAAVDMFRELVSRVEDFNVDEWQLNGLGYDLIEAGRLDDAVRLFEVNVEFFGNETNPHDSLAEAYLLKGDRTKAITHFKRALEIDPTNENARAMLTQLGAL
jgi:CubicO group peptidase (beta-lactamase class C family)